MLDDAIPKLGVGTDAVRVLARRRGLYERPERDAVIV
jgi:hypothetical protein